MVARRPQAEPGPDLAERAGERWRRWVQRHAVLARRARTAWGGSGQPRVRLANERGTGAGLGGGADRGGAQANANPPSSLWPCLLAIAGGACRSATFVLLGAASGAAFQFVEDAIRRMTAGRPSLLDVILGSLGAIGHRVLALWPGWSDYRGARFPCSRPTSPPPPSSPAAWGWPCARVEVAGSGSTPCPQSSWSPPTSTSWR